MCVVMRVASLLSWPPSAIVAPMIDSLSIRGRSPQVTTTCENIMRGSGENGLTLACFRRCIECSIQLSVTTGIIIAWDSVNCSKLMVLDMMWVTFSMGMEPFRFGSQIVAPLSLNTVVSYRSC